MSKRNRKTRESKPTKDSQIGVRFAPDEKQRVESRAVAKGMSAAEYLRDLARRDMEAAA